MAVLESSQTIPFRIYRFTIFYRLGSSLQITREVVSRCNPKPRRSKNRCEKKAANKIVASFSTVDCFLTACCTTNTWILVCAGTSTRIPADQWFSIAFVFDFSSPTLHLFYISMNKNLFACVWGEYFSVLRFICSILIFAPKT